MVTQDQGSEYYGRGCWPPKRSGRSTRPTARLSTCIWWTADTVGRSGRSSPRWPLPWLWLTTRLSTIPPCPSRPSRTATRPSALDHTVLSMLAAPDPDRLRRSRRARRVWAGLAVAAAVLVVVGTLGLLHHPSPGTRTVALHGPGGGHGTAVLVPEAWGTAIELTDSGAGPSEILTVSMRTEYGHLWLAGTYRSTATGGVRVTLACALPVAQIDAIAITNSAGHEVLHS